MLLYIVRHADPIYDPDSITEKGKRQAEEVGRRLAQRAFRRAFASSNTRAIETARPFCQLTGLPLEIEDWMSENHTWRELACEDESGRRVWSFAARPLTEFRTEESMSAGDEWYALPAFSKIDGKRAFERVQRASDEFLARLGYRREGRVYKVEKEFNGRVAAFCHQGFGLTWLSHLLEIPPHILWSRFDISHSGVTILNFETQKDGYTAPRCLCLSDLSHIWAGRLPMTYNNEIEI